MKVGHIPILSSPLIATAVFAAPSRLCTGDAKILGLSSDVWAALVGAFLAGLFSIGSGMLIHRREVKTRYNQWVREQLFEAYSNSFYYLIKLSVSGEKKSTENKDVRQHFSETQRFLNILRGYHANSPEAVRLQRSTQELAANSKKSPELSVAADNALDVVKDLFANDPRVQIRQEG
jgi:hypothetical protein